jgi:hypothetical protein
MSNSRSLEEYVWKCLAIRSMFWGAIRNKDIHLGANIIDDGIFFKKNRTYKEKENRQEENSGEYHV